MRLRPLTALLLTLNLTASSLRAETNQPVRLAPVTVYGTAEGQEVGAPFLPETKDTQIYAGKKTAVIDLQAPPQIQNNNYRQALAKTPGLLLSEETTPLLSLGYRGLEPHRAQFTQVLKDGIPIHADMFGYPEAYYTPPLEQIHHLDFLHGGAALAYGPQPGGALNYVTHQPRTDVPFALRTHHTYGSHDFYATYNTLDGTVGRLGYYAYYHHRQGNGFRAANSDFRVDSGSVKFVLDAQSDSRWTLNVDAYTEEHGEPGGLTLANFLADSSTTTRFNDRFELERYFASLGWDKEFTADTQWSVKAWGGYYSRGSRRQRGGGFGTVPSGGSANSNTIELQEFYTAGVDVRYRHDWAAWGTTHTLAAGTMYYHTDSPRTDKRGATANATDGVVRNRSDRAVDYVPVFIENRFVVGRLSLTPGVRLENIWQRLDESVNADKTAAGTPLGTANEYEFIPLFGVGAAYQLPATHEVYANFSQGYRPKVFTQAIPTGGLSLVPTDLNPSRSWQAEIGARGQPTPYFWWDASLFWMEIRDQIGTVALGGGTNTLANVGDARHRGAEFAAELDLTGWYDAVQGTAWANDIGQVAVYANALLLDAEFTAGPNAGFTPQSAPGQLIRTGLNYRWRDRLKLSLLGTIVSAHYAADNNPADRYIPRYDVWDLTGEWRLFRDNVTVVAGLNNLFDKAYSSRIRADGIDPALGRNFYLGVKLLWP
jgi:Fe(3+) dicitrate transport protein